MTLVQLEYILALNTWRHFATAAEKCNVTQPTLSMQIQKLEEELNMQLFDRSKQPVVPTQAGYQVIEQAEKIIAESNKLYEMVHQSRGVITGELRLAIIPTLAPYLLPLFLKSFSIKYPHVRLTVHEMMTDIIITRLKEGKLDAGILVTPLQEQGISESVLFYEEMLVYVSKQNEAFKKQYLVPQDIEADKLWLLEEGHCFRSQIVNLCELQKKSRTATNFEYEAGSIETLKKMVELNDGITIIPELATYDLSGRNMRLLRQFKHPVPMREVSIVTHRNFVKKQIIEALKRQITDTLPEKIKNNKAGRLVNVK